MAITVKKYWFFSNPWDLMLGMLYSLVLLSFPKMFTAKKVDVIANRLQSLCWAAISNSFWYQSQNAISLQTSSVNNDLAHNIQLYIGVLCKYWEKNMAFVWNWAFIYTNYCFLQPQAVAVGHIFSYLLFPLCFTICVNECSNCPHPGSNCININI